MQEVEYTAEVVVENVDEFQYIGNPDMAEFFARIFLKEHKEALLREVQV